MWFEGTTTPDAFPAKLRDLMLTPDPTNLDVNGNPQPNWQMVSSNVGTTLTDDGYVFYSQGSSGTDNIYIGLKNAYTGATATYWHLGHKFFICESYTPNGTNGVNGTIKNGTIAESLRYHYSATFAGYTNATLPLTYGISITKDRVIITLRSAIRPVDNRIRSVMYLGLINRYTTEKDSSAVVLVTNYGNLNNNYNNITAIKTPNGFTLAPVYASYCQAFFPTSGNRKYGNKFIATPIILHLATQGMRGELDGMLVTKWYNVTAGNGMNVPDEGTVRINGSDYLCLTKIYAQISGIYDNFAPTTSIDMAYFIKKA